MQQGKDGKWVREKLSHFRSGKVDNSDISQFLGGAFDDSEAAAESFNPGKAGEKKHNRPQHVVPFSERKSAASATEETVGKKRRGKRDKLSWGAAGPHEAVVLNDKDGTRRLATAGSGTKAWDGSRLPFVSDGHQISIVEPPDGLIDDAFAPWGDLPMKNMDEMLRLEKELAATRWARHNSIDYIVENEVLEGTTPPGYGRRPATAPDGQLADSITTATLVTSKVTGSTSASDDLDSTSNSNSHSSALRKVRSEQWHIGRHSEAGFRYVAPASRSRVSRRSARPHTDWGGGFSSSDAMRSLRKEKGRAKHLRELRAADVWLHRGTVESIVLARRTLGHRNDTSADLEGIISGGGVSRVDPSKSTDMLSVAVVSSAGSSTDTNMPLSVAVLGSAGSSSDSDTSDRHAQVNYATARRARKKYAQTHLEMEPLTPGGSSALDAALESPSLGADAGFDTMPVWEGRRMELMTSVPHITASSRAFLDPPLTQFRSSHASPVKGEPSPKWSEE